MKKVKYLLGILILGFGLLFGSQSFAQTVVVDGVVNSYNCGNGCSTYKYTFKNSLLSYSTVSKIGWLGYSLFYNGLNQFSILNNPVGSYHCTSTNTGEFNSSVYSYIPYSPSCTQLQNSYIWYNYTYTSTTNPIQVLLGQGSEFGKAFVGVQNANNEIPTYSFGNSFASTNNFITVTNNDSTYYRLIFDSNGLNPLDGFDPITMNGENKTGFNAREYFYNNGTRTNYGYIVDDGTNGYKFKHFGLFDMGYSYVYGKGLSNSASTISWDRLRFVTVEDNIETRLKLFGDVPNSEFNSYSYQGILLIKGSSYTSFGNGNGVYLLSKDPSNPSRVLYEHWSCNISNIKEIFSGGDSVGTNCVKLDGGYLTYNGSTSVLPFTDFNTLTGFTSSNSKLLYDLLYGSVDKSFMQGQTIISGGLIYFNGTNRGYGFITSNSVDIKELYLNGGTNTSTSTSINTQIISNCINDFNFQMSNPFLCNAVSQNLNTSYALGSGYYYQYTVDESGNVQMYIIDQAGLFNGHQTVWLQDGSGNWVTNCTGGWCNPNASNVSGSQFLSGDILVEDFYDGTGLFFACPYPYESVFSFNGWDLKLGKFDIIGPINCFISAFKHGKSYNFFDNHTLYDFGPLISGNTQDHRILFRFFDFLLIIGFTLFFSLLYKRFK